MTPPPPAKKSNVLLWVLVGIGAFMALCAVAVLAFGFFVVQKARHGGLGNITVEDARTGQFKVNSPNGSVQIGGDAKIPTWVPDYPGSNPKTAFSAQGKNGNSSTFSFKTTDAPEKVTKYYQDELDSTGLKVDALVQDHILTAHDEKRGQSLTVITGTEGGETTVTVTYAMKR
jgi:hypothetical protein